MTAKSAHHAVDFNINNEVLSDIVETDEVWEVQTSSYHRLMGRYHLSEDDMGTVANHDHKVEDAAI